MPDIELVSFGTDQKESGSVTQRNLVSPPPLKKKKANNKNKSLRLIFRDIGRVIRLTY